MFWACLRLSSWLDPQGALLAGHAQHPTSEMRKRDILTNHLNHSSQLLWTRRISISAPSVSHMSDFHLRPPSRAKSSHPQEETHSHHLILFHEQLLCCCLFAPLQSCLSSFIQFLPSFAPFARNPEMLELLHSTEYPMHEWSRRHR